MRKKILIALIALLLAGLVSAHYELGEEEEDWDDWHFNTMIEHHGGLSQWVEDHSWGIWEDDEPEYRGYGCHRWR